MEAHTHYKVEQKFYVCSLLADLHWKHIENEIEEVLEGVFNFYLP